MNKYTVVFVTETFLMQIKCIQLYIRELDRDSQCSGGTSLQYILKGKRESLMAEWFVCLILSPELVNCCQWTFLYSNNRGLDTGNIGVVGHVESYGMVVIKFLYVESVQVVLVLLKWLTSIQVALYYVSPFCGGFLGQVRLCPQMFSQHCMQTIYGCYTQFGSIQSMQIVRITRTCELPMILRNNFAFIVWNSRQLIHFDHS